MSDVLLIERDERVAILTVDLAEYVDRVSSGPLGDLSFTREQLEEIRYASKLHDFGKVVCVAWQGTPCPRFRAGLAPAPKPGLRIKHCCATPRVAHSRVHHRAGRGFPTRAAG